MARACGGGAAPWRSILTRLDSLLDELTLAVRTSGPVILAPMKAGLCLKRSPYSMAVQRG